MPAPLRDGSCADGPVGAECRNASLGRSLLPRARDRPRGSGPGRGRLRRSQATPRFVIGDAAVQPWREEWSVRARRGYPARHAYREDHPATPDGRPTPPFHYRDRGDAAVIGASQASPTSCGSVLGRASGFLAWLFLGIHIVYLMASPTASSSSSDGPGAS
jgi:hypothetical protein